MRKSLLPEKYHQYIYLFALIILVIGLPLSKFLMSISQIILVSNWVLEGNLKNKFISFWKNKPALILSSLLLLHFIGLTYTSDFEYAFKDIRIKSPLLILPLILSTSKALSKKQFELVLQFFIGAVILGTVISTFILIGIIPRKLVDIRNISIFISHIRFSLLICVAVFVSGYFFRTSGRFSLKLLWSLLIFWFILFLILLESLTGLAVILSTTFILGLYALLKSRNSSIKYGGLLVFTGLLIGSIFYIKTELGKIDTPVENVDINSLDKTTSRGNLYQHDIINKDKENGNLIWIYYCEKELKEEWNKRSKLDFNWKDLKGNVLRYTLVRFLTSKNLRKDAEGLNQLSDKEIRAIERGVANANYQNISSITGRLHATLWEINVYKNTGEANGHSLTQRFEYWKTALSIIKENLFFGVGTGDIQKAFDEQYVKMNSSLQKEWRLRSHNQYLSIAVSFGITGLTWFLITLFYPMIKQKKTVDYLYITFFIIALFSFLNEDTLETQAGVTFFAFFNTFFLFSLKKEER